MKMFVLSSIVGNDESLKTTTVFEDDLEMKIRERCKRLGVLTKESGEGMAAAALLDLQCTLVLGKERYRGPRRGFPVHNLTACSWPPTSHWCYPHPHESFRRTFSHLYVNTLIMFPETGWVNFQVWIPYSSLGLLAISEFLLYSGYEPYTSAENYMYDARRASTWL